MCGSCRCVWQLCRVVVAVCDGCGGCRILEFYVALILLFLTHFQTFSNKVSAF